MIIASTLYTDRGHALGKQVSAVRSYVLTPKFNHLTALTNCLP